MEVAFPAQESATVDQIVRTDQTRPIATLAERMSSDVRLASALMREESVIVTSIAEMDLTKTLVVSGIRLCEFCEIFPAAAQCVVT